jgi:phosphoglycolate phosphatase-like HAD superfamily hydrolase
MRLVLFDIDGTLILTGGIGQTSARVSLERVFGTSGHLDNFYPGGRTIEAIFQDTLEDAGIGSVEYKEKRDALYADFFEEFKNRLDSNTYQIRALPGAMQLVGELSARLGFILGLVTGNHQFTARYKLAAAGFNLNLFSVGAYGDEATHRPDLIPLVKRRAAEIVGLGFDGSDTVMIGDTTRDVLSAKEAGAFSIAVASGTDDWDMLEAVAPDVLLDGLGDVASMLELLSAASIDNRIEDG